MNPSSQRSPSWATTSSREALPSMPMEIDELGEHFRHCGALCGPGQRIRSAASLLHGFVASRAVSFAVVIASAGGLWWLLG